MKTGKLLLLALSATFFTACSSDDEPGEAPLGTYDDGLFVLNEGGMGEVTFIGDGGQTVQQNVFETVNGTAQDLGQYAQSMFFDGDRAFIISNGSNKITVVNRYSFAYIATISTGLTVPRYGVVHNGKAYVTNSNSFDSATDDFIAVIDLATLAVEDPIIVNDQAERLVAYNGKLYVSSGFYGVGNKINVFNAEAKTFVTSIVVGETPNSLEVKNETLYVLCGNYTDDSKLVKIKLADDTILDEVPFPGTMDLAQNLDIEGDRIYFTVGPKVHSVATNAIAVTDTPLFNTGSTGLYVGYGFAVHDGRIYVAEAADDFTSDGKVYVYSLSGNEITEIPAGLGPNGFYFND
jgi:hypothetical protein